ncbi:ribonuclease p/mrp subunit, putative [Pediculus humanus corporis]|uniref:Ribonuclease p/mrp subunit, putative n=1 Tax=Pediculus humanus subsp. corporis TaxID=121224 RepID=E0VG14_PEDHC|nr:ribonuclease p/mrp subunit, putative [Pediculus humanus corporis]EEB12320.1 ribonuclease p/mrp subunit, putative [Pediculus humanus corporis]
MTIIHFKMFNERLKLHRFHKWLYDKIEESFIFRNWLSYKKNLAWRFLNLAQDESQSYRTRAVISLASLTNLTDSDYQQLAQSCDMRTAIGLARSANNSKFLLDPPYFKIKANHSAIIKNFQEFFVALESETKHPCFHYFVSKFVDSISDVDSKSFDDDLKVKIDNKNFIPLCLEALLHHSWTNENAKQIVRLGGLPLLTEVYKYLQETENLESLIALSKLISNISACSECWIKLLSTLSRHKDIRVSAPAQKALCNFDTDDPIQKDVNVYSSRVFPLHPTSRTLLNPKLDVIFIHGLLGGVFITWRQRDFGHCTHKSPLELLGDYNPLCNNNTSSPIPTAASKKVPSFPPLQPGLTFFDKENVVTYQMNKSFDQEFFVDVRDFNKREKLAEGYEFVLHDIPIDCNFDSTGPYYGSPKEEDLEGNLTRCWPKDWLAKDCPEIRLIGVNYESNISQWTPLCPLAPMSGTILERSFHLVNILCEAGVGKRPIVWISHSMGGLIVKGILSIAHSSSNPQFRSLLDQTKGIIFYSTPHKGSRLAALNTTSQMIVWPSIEVQELRENSPGLLKLHEDFLRLTSEKPIKVVTFSERESTYITALKFELQFVDSHSAYPDVGENFGIPLDHLCICKPCGRCGI